MILAVVLARLIFVMSCPGVHKSSMVIGLGAASLLVLINIPGRVVDGTQFSWTTFEHGWPWVYLRREIVEPPPPVGDPALIPFGRYAVSRLPMWGIPWLTPANWKLWEANDVDGNRRWRVNLGILVSDIVIALGVVALTVAAWEARRRRRPRILSFTIADMLVAVAVLSAVLARASYLQQDYQREEKALVNAEGISWYVQHETCVAPLWLRSMIGDAFFPKFCWRAVSVTIDPEMDGDVDDVAQRISRLAFVRKIEIGLYQDTSFRFSALNAVPQLHTLEIDGERPMDDRDVDELAQLVHLRKLVFYERDEVPSDVLARLEVALPNCEIVDYLDDW